MLPVLFGLGLEFVALLFPAHLSSHSGDSFEQHNL